jgi:hypothetical protein
METLLRTTTQYESFAHRYLWEGVRLQLQKAEEKLEGSWYFYLAACLMAYLTYEAYLNYVGETVAPEDWKQERELFSAEPYKGTNGKLKRLRELYNLPYPDMGAKPFIAISELKALRDAVVHARPVRGVHEAIHPSTKVAASPPGWLSRSFTPRKVKQMLGNMEAAIEALHADFLATMDGHALWPYPLKGTFGVGTGFAEMHANPQLNRTRRKRRAG